MRYNAGNLFKILWDYKEYLRMGSKTTDLINVRLNSTVLSRLSLFTILYDQDYIIFNLLNVNRNNLVRYFGSSSNSSVDLRFYLLD